MDKKDIIGRFRIIGIATAITGTVLICVGSSYLLLEHFESIRLIFLAGVILLATGALISLIALDSFIALDNNMEIDDDE